MALVKLEVEDFASWDEYYWSYQYSLARDYYAPLLSGWGLGPEGLRVIDIGCGNGGFTAALADLGSECVGVEVKPFERKPRESPRLSYVIQDITASDAPAKLGGGYDLVLLRDVIEHIPLTEKAAFMACAKGFMADSGSMLATFPPYYSPFGLHQQVLLKSGLRKLPFLSMLPWPVLGLMMSFMNEPGQCREAVAEIRQSRMTMGGFLRLAGETGLVVERSMYHLVRPSHEIRYGWRTRPAPWGIVPLVREMFVLGALFLLRDQKA